MAAANVCHACIVCVYIVAHEKDFDSVNKHAGKVEILTLLTLGLFWFVGFGWVWPLLLRTHRQRRRNARMDGSRAASSNAPSALGMQSMDDRKRKSTALHQQQTEY